MNTLRTAPATGNVQTASGVAGMNVGTDAKELTAGQFARELDNVRKQVTVKAGDTLSGILKSHLQQSQPDRQVSAADLYRMSWQIAKANAIPNANLIYPGQQINLDSASIEGAAPSSNSPVSNAKSASSPLAGPAGFIARHLSVAQKIEQETGIPATFMISQAALETGWGRQEIVNQKGQTSFNLFAIRADSSWKGPVTEVDTREFINGSYRQVKANFRAYSSYEESFRDYAQLLQQNPKYSRVLQHGNNPQVFAQALQQAGYATAPNYASALVGVIQTTERLASGLNPAQVAIAAPSTIPAQVFLNSGLRFSTNAAMPSF